MLYKRTRSFETLLENSRQKYKALEEWRDTEID